MITFPEANQRGNRRLRVSEYCLRVEDAVRAAQPTTWDGESPECRQWLIDSDQAASAATYAVEGREAQALVIAERLTGRYGRWLQV